jgi:hypothetical protein
MIAALWNTYRFIKEYFNPPDVSREVTDSMLWTIYVLCLDAMDHTGAGRYSDRGRYSTIRGMEVLQAAGYATWHDHGKWEFHSRAIHERLLQDDYFESTV